MNSNIAALVDYYERERELPREKVLSALEHAFLTAYKKMVPGAENIHNLSCEIDVPRGIVKIFAHLLVVADDDLRDSFNEVKLSLASKIRPDAQIGEDVYANVTPQNFGRIAIQTARQTITQRLRDAEKEILFETFKDRAGDLVAGTIRRYEKGDIIVDIDGKNEGVMPSRERIAGEDYSVGDRFRFYIFEVRDAGKGFEVILSRSHPNLIRRLFETEVAEIADGTVEIQGIAREAGSRTKIAVISHDPKVDPVGACVGIRGARVKHIVSELNNEKIDIIEWTEDPAEFVRRALAPVELREVNIDEPNKCVLALVNDDKELAKAIGRRGQNARLTARLLGWDVQVKIYNPEADIFKKSEQVADELSKQLGISREVALGLAMMGGTTIDVIAEMEPRDIAEALQLSHEGAVAIIEKVRSLLA